MLDNRTALCFTAALDLILPIYAWVALAGQRTRATVWWCASGPFLGIGISLLVLRSTIPDFLSFNLGNLLIVAGFLVSLQSLRLQIGPPPRMAWMGWVLLMYLVCHGWLLETQALQTSVSFSRGVLAALIATNAALCWKFARREPSQNIRAIAAVFSLLAVVMLLQFIQTVSGNSPVTMFIPGDLMAEVVTIVGQVTAVVSYFSFVGLEMDRSMRIQVQIAADQARVQEDLRVQKQLAQLDQQNSLDIMSATLGHELNQPLTAVLTNAQVAERAVRAGRGTPALLNELFDKIVFNTKRAAQIIERFHSFKRPQDLKKMVISLDQLVTDTLKLMARELQQNQVGVSIHPPASSIRVLVDPIQLSQVLVNVLRNAVVAMQSSAVRQIQISWEQDTRQARLTLHDTGHGLSPEQLQQAGVPFYTTKTAGMGLGLSISRAILAQHDGALALRNADSGGAVVELQLPVFLERRAA